MNKEQAIKALIKEYPEYDISELDPSRYGDGAFGLKIGTIEYGISSPDLLDTKDKRADMMSRKK